MFFSPDGYTREVVGLSVLPNHGVHVKGSSLCERE